AKVPLRAEEVVCTGLSIEKVMMGIGHVAIPSYKDLRLGILDHPESTAQECT
ncbi:hypothetical protein TorRG33x02_182590, partial [Trema orientale]